jgi:CDP-paratose 2-epimerase
MILTVLITGSAGLIGSEAVRHFSALGWRVHGVDNNLRADFFGPDGDTTWNLERLRESCPDYRHHAIDIRDRAAVLNLLSEVPADLIVHAAAQPSHDLAAKRPFDDFDVNAVGTLNLLEATRRYRPEAGFAFLSTNKVYGDAPNELPLVELATRWEYARPEDFHGISEQCRIDQSKHSLFGASKVAADVLVQEYGRYFGMKTMCLRGGCLTGAAHSGAELHGFLAYLARCVVEGRPYRVYGYKGKQVRDNIDARDVCRLIERFHSEPKVGAVYNIGGGRSNSVSMLEAITRLEALAGRKLNWSYVDEPRSGDHICYISDLRKLMSDFPGWRVEVSLDSILEDIVRTLWDRMKRAQPATAS